MLCVIKYSKSTSCKSDYFKYGEACLKIPDNAYASGESWKCNLGYEKVGDICKAKVSSEELIAAQKIINFYFIIHYIMSYLGIIH